MNEIFDAEVYVDTVFSIESGQNSGNWFRLADYGSLSEFHIDCASWFSDEENPEYVYMAWENIPDCLIRRDWLCPNIFELIDALRMVDEAFLDDIADWCEYHGYSLACDEPYQLITDYNMSLRGHPVSDRDLNLIYEMEMMGSTDPCYEGNDYPLPAFYGEIFNENYN